MIAEQFLNARATGFMTQTASTSSLPRRGMPFWLISGSVASRIALRRKTRVSELSSAKRNVRNSSLAVADGLDQVAEVLDLGAVDRLDDLAERLAVALGHPVREQGAVTTTSSSPGKCVRSFAAVMIGLLRPMIAGLSRK